MAVFSKCCTDAYVDLSAYEVVRGACFHGCVVYNPPGHNVRFEAINIVEDTRFDGGWDAPFYRAQNEVVMRKHPRPEKGKIV
jgi:hypothetical protein